MSRLTQSISLVIGLLMLVLISYWWQQTGQFFVEDVSYLTGWVLFTLFVLLMGFGVRKKVNFYPLISVKHWANVHYILGAVFIFLFLLHLKVEFVNGIFENVLFYSMLVTLISGLFGLYWSKSIPKKLSKSGDVAIFEVIPQKRYEIKNAVEQVVVKAIEIQRSIEIETFYRVKLEPFLKGSNNFREHLFHSTAPLHNWESSFNNLRGHLNEEQLAVLEKLWPLVKQKLKLDYQHSQLYLLKIWLFVHLPAAFVSLLLISFHLLMVYGFVGEI